MKKILFILPGLGAGGAERNTVNLANYMCSLGHSVAIITLTDEKDFFCLLNESIIVHDCQYKRLRNSIFGISKIIRILNPDIVYANLWPVTFISLFAKYISFTKTKIILVEHINLTHGLRGAKILERLFARIAHWIGGVLRVKFIAVSNGVRHDLIKNFNINPKNIRLIYNPVIYNEPYAKNISPKIINYKTNEIKILSIGNFKKQKDHANLLKAISILKNEMNLRMKCTLIGDGLEMNNLIKLTTEYGIEDEIVFAGRIVNVEEYYLNTDVFVLSSKYEGFGNVLVEALSYGCRIVSTNCESGPNEILCNHELGILVQHSDSRELALGILKSLSLDIDQNQLIKRSYDFKVDNIAFKYMEYINGKY